MKENQRTHLGLILPTYLPKNLYLLDSQIDTLPSIQIRFMSNTTFCLRSRMVQSFIRIHIHIVKVYGIRTKDKIIQCGY